MTRRRVDPTRRRARLGRDRRTARRAGAANIAAACTCLAVVLAGCGGGTGDEPTKEQKKASTSAAPKTSPAPTPPPGSEGPPQTSPPAPVPAPPGATETKSEAGAGFSRYEYTTTGSPQEVLSHYTTTLQAAGWVTKASSASVDAELSGIYGHVATGTQSGGTLVVACFGPNMTGVNACAP